jgi:hypothetical protein
LYIQDGDWGTFAGAVPPGAVFASSYYNVSYSVPPNKKPQALEFKYEYYSYDVGDNQNYLENLTNIEACVNSGKVQFSFQIDAGNSIGELYCYNQSGKWDKLTDFFGDGSGWAVGIYEERLWWNCTEGAMSVCNDNGTCDAGETAENCPSDCSAEEESCILAWQKNFSSAGNAADFAMSIISDSSGSLYAAGSGVNINSASSGSDWWIMKLNSADGSRIWDKNFSSSGSYGDFANSLIQDLSGNSLYVAGYGNNLNSASSGEDWWIMKLNSADGSRIWDKNFSWDGRDRANSISKGLQEEIYVVGDSGLGSNSDFRVVRLNSTGVQNWSVAFSSSIDWGFSSAYGFESLYVAGYKGGTGWWVMRINITNGNKIWESTFAGGPGAYATTVALDDSNNIYVGGYGLNLASPTSNWDWWIMKLNATNGSRIWDKNFSTSDDSADIAYSISIDSSGNLYAVGTGKNLTTTNSNWDWWIMKLNTLNGNKIWEMNFSSQIGSSPDAPYYISYDSFGNIYIAGYGSQLARVPPNPSGGDWWIMKLDCGGGPRGCTPGEKKSCYTGPAGTNGTGICRNGNQTCMADGTWNGTCVGQVTPLGSEICFGEYDEDCDGDIDCNDTNCFGTQWCPEVECPFVLSFPCVDSRGNDVECTVSNCWEIDFMNANSQEKQAYCENCPIETGDECIWVNGGCRRKGAIEGCYQQIKENENCGPSDPTHQIVYSWYNVTTLAYSLNCEEDDCGDNPGCVVNIPCSSVLKLNYFEIGNLIAVVLILVIIYWMWMRYGSRKVGKAKRKRKEG